MSDNTQEMTSWAVEIKKVGGIDKMKLVKQMLSPLKAQEVRIQHKAIGVNYIDIYHRRGIYPLPLPFNLGVEGAGEVIGVGEGVTDFKLGDRVAYCSGGVGSYSTIHDHAAGRLIPLPEHISYETAAALLLKGMTVEYLINRLYPVQKGEVVLWHAIAGGVGQLALQWLLHKGVTVIATAGSPEKRQWATQMGCQHVFSYQDDLPTRVKEITDNQGVSVVYDGVGKDTFSISLSCLKRRGMFVSFGNASGVIEKFDIGLLARHGSLFATRPGLFDYIRKPQEMLDSAKTVMTLAKDTLQVNISEILPLSRCQEAHRKLQERQTSGSILLSPLI